MEAYSILLVDDDPFILEGIGADLESQGFKLTEANSGGRALELLAKQKFDLVITDLVMENVDGIQVLKEAKALHPDTMVIILTGYGNMASAIEALRHEADDYLLKPCESAEMLHRIHQCQEKAALRQKLKLYQKLLPMCCVCKKIRDDRQAEPGRGKWVEVEQFIHDKANLDITSSYCPDCAQQTMESFTNRNSSHTEK
ncbi:MAG: response regulator [Deltaproteobacteria bacterium]|jgi:YesN/AraC family two-component response regulator|nr:response regulator [Deltaproteobacteria bacterium]